MTGERSIKRLHHDPSGYYVGVPDKRGHHPVILKNDDQVLGRVRTVHAEVE